MSVTVIEDERALPGLGPGWDALWRRCPMATPFQHPAWLLPWWGAFGTGRPMVAVAETSGMLTGVMAAYVLEEAGGAKLLPMGAGTSDYLDALGDGAADMLAALLQCAAARGVRRCDWMELPPWSALADVRVPVGWEARVSVGESCPVGAPGAVPKGIARKLRMNRHRAERDGGWAMSRPDGTGLDELVRLHQARWTACGEPGVLADPAVLACLDAALPALDSAGLLRPRLLHVGGRLAASVLALQSPGRVYFYLSGYDTAQGFVSPGTLLLGAMLEEADADGLVEAHFLRGREGYKYAWGAEDRLNRMVQYNAPGSA